MEIAYSLSGDFQSLSLFFIAICITAICCLLALFSVRSTTTLTKSKFIKSDSSGGISFTKKTCDCACSCRGGGGGGGGGANSDLAVVVETTSTPHLNGGADSGGVGGGDMLEMLVAVERQTGASMMEQLVPEITTHALSYLDYPSLCRLSMTNSQMRKAANDDNAWKALYHKDFTWEQDSVTPANGWKAYYAATRAIVNINAEFFNIIRERSLPAMGSMWLNADYVKCVHASGELFTGYNAVMESWQHAFNWDVDFQVRDVRARVLTDMSWVTMKTYVEVDAGPFNMSNVFEFHNGRWFMVHHHSSLMLMDGGGDENQQILLG